jgi:hypothetical protein
MPTTPSLVRSLTFLLAILIVGSALGCAGRPTIVPNPDPALRKTAAQFAADAARRHPYKADAPRAGQAQARAQVGYMLNQFDVVNLSQEEWTDVEVWLNQGYVVFVPKMEPGVLKRLPFTMFYDDRGNTFPTRGRLATKLEIYRDGRMYDVPLRLAD